LLYGSGSSSITATDAKRITAAEIKYMKKQLDTLGHKHRLPENLTPVLDEIQY